LSPLELVKRTLNVASGSFRISANDPSEARQGHFDEAIPVLPWRAKLCHRAEWLAKISEPGVRRRAEFYYQQLDALRCLRQEVRGDLLAESKKHKAWKLLCQIPSIDPIRSAVLLGILQTPHRFRTKRQLWTYVGVGIETSSSADHRLVKGQLERKQEAGRDSRAEQKLQSRSEESVQRCGGGRRD
jgi:transposase